MKITNYNRIAAGVWAGYAGNATPFLPSARSVVGLASSARQLANKLAKGNKFLFLI